jgi:cytochrome P450
MAHILSPVFEHLTLLNLIFVAFAAYTLRYIWFELTIGARRRRLIAEKGCEPAYQYPHKGLLGRWLGFDVLQEMMRSGRDGRMQEASRLRNFNNGIYTLQSRRLTQDQFVTIEPENVKSVLATDFQSYCLGKARADLFIPLFGHGIFDTDGAAWERSRSLIRPNFVRAQVADLDMFERHMEHLISHIPRDGSTVDLQPLFFGLTMDSATEFLFGKSTNTLAPGLETQSANEFVKAFIYCTERVSVELRTFGLLSYVPNPTWRRNVKTVHTFADDIVREALDKMKDPAHVENLKAGREKYTFLYELASRTQDPYTLRSELLNVLLAGRDTTAGLLSNTWHVLSKRKDIWNKLRGEVDELGGERPDYQTLKDMKYLKWVMNECLRLMPVVPGNSRQAIRDTVLPVGGGKDQKSPILVKKDQVVAYQVWSMHRREDFYGPDAHEFKPERWETLRPGW